jgi:hypothetical protein
MIIGIAGKKQVGKDTLGKMIKSLINEDWQIKKFAGKVKEVCSILTGIPVKDFEKEEVKNSYLGEEWQIIKIKRLKSEVEGFIDTFYEPYTIRQLLQRVGTDAIRDVIHPNAWVNALFAEYKLDDGKVIEPISNENKVKYSAGFAPLKQQYFREPQYSNWIITDVRFPNEAEAIKQRDGKLIVVRRNTNDTDTHPSEVALDSYDKWDFIVPNTGTLEDLLYQAKFIVDTLKLRQTPSIH